MNLNNETDLQIDEFRGDGESRSFYLTWPLAGHPIIGDTSPGRKWEWDIGSRIITSSDAPRFGEVIPVEYIGRVPASEV